MSLRDFIIMDKLGEGSYAKVYKARRLADQKVYALKQVHVISYLDPCQQAQPKVKTKCPQLNSIPGFV